MRHILFILGWLWTVMLCVIYSCLICMYAFFPIIVDGTVRTFSPTAVLLPTFICIGLSILFVKVLRKRKWDTKGYLRISLLFLFSIPLVFLAIDSAPIENDYTLDDILPQGKDIKASYETLMTLRKGGGLTIQTEAPHINNGEAFTNALPYAEEIEKAWNDISEARKVIEKLDTFDTIPDLIPTIPLSPDTPILNFVTLRNIARTYQAYAELKAEQGKPEEGIAHLVKLHSVARKALPYSIILIDKMIWTAIAKGNIESASRMAARLSDRPDMIQMLKTGFPPLSEEAVSMRRVLIGEYLYEKRICSDYITGKSLSKSLELYSKGRPINVTERVLSEIVFPFTFNRNRTIQDLRSHYDLLISDLEKGAPSITIEEQLLEKHKKPALRNIVGQCFIAICIPSFKRSFEITSRTKALSDLLAIDLERASTSPQRSP